MESAIQPQTKTPTAASPGSATSATTAPLTLAAGNVPDALRKPQPRRVREKTPVLIARPAVPGQIHKSIEGRLTRGEPGDWVLCTPTGATLRLVSETVLSEGYEIVEEGGLTLSGREARRLEDRLGPGTTASGEKLLAAVERLARIGVGEIELPFTPGQLEEMKHRADRRGRTLKDEFKLIVSRLADELFHGGRG